MWRSAVQLCLGLLKNRLGGLAQLARASALHAEGQRFESVILHKKEIIDILHKKEKSKEITYKDEKE